MRVLRCLVPMLVVLTAASAFAQLTPEQNKLLAKRAAEADAYRKLAEAVYGLQINAQTNVRDFVAESDDIRTEVDTFIKGVRLGQPTWYEDGSCEVPAEVTVAKVVEVLRAAHERYYKGHDIKASDFESITKRIEKEVIKTVGSGAPRPDLPPDLPNGAEALIEPPPKDLPKPPIPEIWIQAGAQARLMAIRAARVDAMRRLAERLKGLRLTSQTRVSDFVTQSDEIRTMLDAYLKTSGEERNIYLHSDELIAEVTLRVPTEQVITTIKELHSRHYKGDDVKGHDLEQVIKTVIKKDFEETGMGVPPPKYMEQYARKAEVQLPEWAMGSLSATGEGTDPAMDTPQGRLKAARAAELDAKRKLVEQVRGLRIRGETSVKDLVTQRDDIATDIDAIINNATVDKTEFSDSSARVTVTLHGMQLWGAVNGTHGQQ